MTEIKILQPGDGWQLRDQDGNVLLAVDATNRKVDIPSGTTLTASGTELTGASTGDLIFDDPVPTSDPEVDRHVYSLNGVLMVSAGPVA